MAEQDDDQRRPPAGEPSPQLSDAECERELERALTSRVTELPENRPRGLLGELNPDLRAIDAENPPDLNSGISQETDLPIVWLGMWLGFLLGVLPGFIVLWVSKYFTMRQKVVWSVVMAVLAVGIVVAYATRR